MVLGGMDQIIVYVCGCFWLSAIVNGRDVCRDAVFTQYAKYDRTTNWTSVCVKTGYMRCFARLDGGSLVKMYPWVNVSDIEPEQTLARVQLAMLAEMVPAFPNKETVSIEIKISDDCVTVGLNVDYGYVVWKLNDSQALLAKTLRFKESELKPYMKIEKFTTFLRVSETVLGRWRQACHTAMELSKPASVNVTFIYHADTSVYECFMTTPTATRFYFGLRCDIYPMEWQVVEWPDEERLVQRIRWKSPTCRPIAANCTVWPADGAWYIVARAQIRGETPKNISAVTVPEFGSGIGVAVAFVTTVGLLMCIFCEHRSCARTVGRYVGDCVKKMWHNK